MPCHVESPLAEIHNQSSFTSVPLDAGCWMLQVFIECLRTHLTITARGLGLSGLDHVS